MRKIIIFYSFSVLLLLMTHWLIGPNQMRSDQLAVGTSPIATYLNSNLNTSFEKVSLKNASIRLIFGIKNQISKPIAKDIEHLFLWSLFSLNFFHIGIWIKLLTQIFYPKIKKINIFNLLNFIIKKITLSKYRFYLLLFTYSYLVALLQGYLSAVFTIIFIGTYYHVQDETRLNKLILMIVSYLLICIYLEKNFSFIGFMISGIVIFYFEKVYPFLFFSILASLATNKKLWINVLFKSLFSGLHYLSILTNLDSLHSTVLLSFTLFIIYLTKKYWLIVVVIIIHSEPAFTPTIFFSK